MEEQSHLAPQALNALMICRSLERVGDHATNIAEDVIFWVQGADVRHHKSVAKAAAIAGAAAAVHVTAAATDGTVPIDTAPAKAETRIRSTKSPASRRGFFRCRVSEILIAPPNRGSQDAPPSAPSSLPCRQFGCAPHAPRAFADAAG